MRNILTNGDLFFLVSVVDRERGRIKALVDSPTDNRANKQRETMIQELEAMAGKLMLQIKVG